MSSSEEEEEFLVNVEFNGMLEKDILDRSPVFLKMIDVEGKNPVMQIGNQTFAGEYRDIVGTALFFEEDPVPPGGDSVFTTIPEHQLRYVCKTRKALHMSRVFLQRKDSAENTDAKYGVKNDSGVEPDVDISGNSVSMNQKIATRNVCNSPSDNLSMEIEELHSMASKKQEPRRNPDPEPVAGPSWMSDLPRDDVRDLETLMEATASKRVTHEISELIEKQINITTDSTENIVTDSDSVCDG
ncbi:hypothetical protein B7P43_G09867 [Cryptotermes secundus]|uniref:Transcription factor TFIIIC triple barrel domain-containing protein n=1 Tax=Cryptotermes secundus TaxID=105785 RepID=A0A2J7PC60_9NEOP|nr:general transcription factor 3C polypeptide 6 [Cryptotermes secundus]PNF13921.1 hypothetical protein B7P43_G09867 [Cryptotermes secundus]